MMILGCELRRLSFTELTAATAVGVALWLVFLLVGLVSLNSVAAGGSLVAIVWGSVSNACGIRVAKGWRPMLLNVMGCVLVLLLYHAVRALL